MPARRRARFFCLFEGCPLTKGWQNKNERDQHMAHSHGMLGVPQFFCEVPGCNFHTYGPSSLKRHQKKHGDLYWMYNCPMCKGSTKGSQGPRSDNLRRHFKKCPFFDGRDLRTAKAEPNGSELDFLLKVADFHQGHQVPDDAEPPTLPPSEEAPVDHPPTPPTTLSPATPVAAEKSPIQEEDSGAPVNNFDLAIAADWVEQYYPMEPLYAFQYPI